MWRRGAEDGRSADRYHRRGPQPPARRSTFVFGAHDVVVIAEVLDSVTAAAISITVSASGPVRTKTVPLLTLEEVDQALGKTVQYRPLGSVFVDRGAASWISSSRRPVEKKHL